MSDNSKPINDSEYLKDVSDQIRSEINEFYLVNSAFIIADSIWAAFMRDGSQFILDNKTLFVILIFAINIIWFFSISLQNRWISYWREKSKNHVKDKELLSIWTDDTEIRLLGLFKLRQLFYVIPALFLSIFLYFTLAGENIHYYLVSLLLLWAVWILFIIHLDCLIAVKTP